MGAASNYSFCGVTSSRRKEMTGHHRIGMDLMIGFFSWNKDGGDDDGSRAVPHPTLTYKIPRYADRQPYNGKAMEAG
jgi:hypothetical protein